MRRQLGLENRTVILWLVGAIRPVYHMMAEIGAFFRACQQRLGNAVLLVLTKTENADELLRSSGLSDDEFLTTSVVPQEVPRFAQAADAGLSFRDITHHGSPVKLAEYLAMGIPTAVNKGQSGFDLIIDAARAGVVIRSCTAEGYSEAARELAELLQDRQAVAQRCRSLAEEKFSLRSAVDKYEEVYHALFR